MIMSLQNLLLSVLYIGIDQLGRYTLSGLHIHLPIAHDRPPGKLHFHCTSKEDETGETISVLLICKKQRERMLRAKTTPFSHGKSAKIITYLFSFILRIVKARNPLSQLADVEFNPEH